MDKEYLAGLFAEQTTAQKYRLEQYTQEELIKLYAALNRVQDDILRRWGKSIKTEWSQTRAVGMIEEARGLMNEIKPKIEGSIASTLGHISSESASVYSEMLTFGGKAKAAKTAMLSAEQMAAYWKTTPVGGHLLNDWVNRTFDGPTIEAIQREVFAGMFQGEGYPKMIKRLQEGFTLTKREAETLVRTYVHTANVHAMKEVYGKNRDVIAGVRWLTALDERTCMRCAALAGKLYPLDDHPPCPLHPRCRCVLIPETNIKKLKVSPRVAKDWKDGLDTQVPDLDKVVTPDGIPKMDFRAWIMSRPEKDQLRFFGPTRYGLLKDGKVGWDDLFEEIRVDGKENIRLRRLTELLGDRAVAHRAGKGYNVAVEQLALARAEREALDLARHEAMAGKLDERALEKLKRFGENAAGVLALTQAIPETLVNYEQNLLAYQHREKIDALVRAVAKREGLPEDFVERYFERVVEGGKLRQRVDSKSLQGIVESNRVKTQIETGRTYGAIEDISTRKDISRNMFGTNVGIDDSKYEKYGYLAFNDVIDITDKNLKWYGEIILEYKDDIKARTTFTLGDSYANNAGNGYIIGSKISSPSRYSIGMSGAKEEIAKIAELYKRGDFDLHSLLNETRISYFELQYHGEITLENVQRIIFMNDVDLTDELRSRLERRGIRIDSYKQSKK